MIKYSVLLLLLVARSYGHVAERVSSEERITGNDGRVVEETLLVEDPYKEGKWGIIEVCPIGSVIGSVDIKFHEPNNYDETAINAVKLYCQSREDGRILNYITSTVGEKGSYQGIQSCSDGFVTGVRIKVLEKGFFSDNVAVQDFQMSCNYGQETIDGMSTYVDIHRAVPIGQSIKDARPRAFKEGEWSKWMECQLGHVLCGLEVRYDGSSLGDQVAVSDVAFFCCE